MHVFILKAMLVWGAWAAASSEQAVSNPMGTVLQLLADLTAKLTKDGENEAKAYQEYFEWCDETSKNTAYAIETAEKGKAKLEANIAELNSKISVAGSKIEELAASVGSGQKELKDATAIRDKEAADFVSKEMAKNPASFAQMDTKNVATSLKA